MASGGQPKGRSIHPSESRWGPWRKAAAELDRLQAENGKPEELEVEVEVEIEEGGGEPLSSEALGYLRRHDIAVPDSDCIAGGDYDYDVPIGMGDGAGDSACGSGSGRNVSRSLKRKRAAQESADVTANDGVDDN